MNATAGVQFASISTIQFIINNDTTFSTLLPNNYTSTTPSPQPTTWTSLALLYLFNTNILYVLLAPLLLREIPTMMTTTLDPLLDYVFDPWSWSYFPVWCAEVWRLLRDEHHAHFAHGRVGAVTAAAGTVAAATAGAGSEVVAQMASVQRVWREAGLVEEITLSVGKGMRGAA